ncbi:glycoside hydrolase family 88 protein [Bacteroides coprosuis]|uniref:glycoside hydrolase family 88 protein n=1 Tax=Bacteroides coprosuis TaxID=151276 RepID=UPI001D2ECB50|nr:glycoside hydrolase family 88 protein [Bacteroides coprosuis]HJD92225.1 glycoside hydrolase family 88 protein [Bacteroides coprosuis]
MTMKLFTRSAAVLLAIFMVSCSNSNKEGQNENWAKNAVEIADAQLKVLVQKSDENMDQKRDSEGNLPTVNAESKSGAKLLPRSIGKNGKVRFENPFDWTSGFFPGTLWYQYELTGDEFFKEKAKEYTALLKEVSNYPGTHDLGFMMFCSYGNQLRLTHDAESAPLMVSTADNLISRFDPTIKAIRSWDFGKWNFPVIIDNMMNLELLFWASEYTNDPKYREVAIEHANTTLKHHFRDDMSSYHVISYNNDGTVEIKGTFQGYADDSDWARGQGWALYGYTVMYRFTQDPVYLKAAQDIAHLIMTEETMPDDQIPYWDFDADDIPNAPRDVSAAALISSALFELSTMVEDGQNYFNQAEVMLKNLSKEPYLANGDNEGFILKHATGHLPANSEIDTPLNYADYYYVEALKRYFDLTGVKYPLNANK